MKNIFFTLLILLAIDVVGQSKNDTLHWRAEYKLTWDDFQGVPDTNSIGMAGTSSSFFYHSYYKADTLIFSVDCVFFKKNSWVKNKWKDSATLNHEQGHFNITEVYARILLAALRKYKLNKTTVIQDIKNIKDSIQKKEDIIQKQYDKETTYPINNNKQRVWDKKIESWLKNTN